MAERMEEDAFHRGCNLTVLIENFKDQIFWETLIEHIVPELKFKIDFPFYSPKGTRGKTEILKFKDFIKSNFIICVDSDCDHLYAENHWIDSKYIYHTFVNSVEIYQCNPNGMSLIVREITTLNYDFNSLFTNLSATLETLFYFIIYVNRINYQTGKEILCNKNLENLLEVKEGIYNSVGDESIIFQSIEDKANELLDNLKSEMTESWYDEAICTDIEQIKEELKSKYGITKDDICCFIQGHAIFEKFVIPFTKDLIKCLAETKKQQIENELHTSSKTDKSNAIDHFTNIVTQQDLATKINDNYKYPIFNPQSFKWIKYVNSKILCELNI